MVVNAIKGTAKTPFWSDPEKTHFSLGIPGKWRQVFPPDVLCRVGKPDITVSFYGVVHASLLAMNYRKVIPEGNLIR
ncbi:MAG: hypothetical protein ABJD58_03035 [Cyclobacteriaceae bacterium]